MVDLSRTIAPKSDQLNADDLISGAKTIKITDVKLAETPEQPISIFFDGDNGKPYKPCKSMRRVLVQIWGSDGRAFIGRSMTLYRDEGVKFGGMDVGGIRISHMSDMKGNKPVTLALTASKANRKPFKVMPLVIEQVEAKPQPSTPETFSLTFKNRDTGEIESRPLALDKWLKNFEAMLKAAIDADARQHAFDENGPNIIAIVAAHPEMEARINGIKSKIDDLDNPINAG